MRKTLTASRVAILSMTISGLLAVIKITAGVLAGSTSVLADGFESASDVVASGVVLFGLAAAARPADEDHPYGHGRLETLSGFVVGIMLAVAGAGISIHATGKMHEIHPRPQAYAAWALVFSILMKAGLSTAKFHFARKTRSEGLRADAWNDTVDIVSGVVALCSLGLTLYDPSRFLAADHVGGILVGIIVIYLGVKVTRDSTLQLMDTMPEAALIEEIRGVAGEAPGVLLVEKCYARKTGLQYHVDLHLEVDPELTVRESHEIARDVRRRIRDRLDWVADVLVHVEPGPPRSRLPGR
ncbi:MAG: cation transporter [Bryobacterales bacterium]|nr:cation transporter [Bryobacterales bacterium]